jgi:hypothetical protein
MWLCLPGLAAVATLPEKSVMALAKMLGYRLQGAQAATTDVLV